MRIVKVTGDRRVIVGRTKQNSLGYVTKNGQFKEPSPVAIAVNTTGVDGVRYEIRMSVAEALELAAWAIQHALENEVL